MITRIITFSLKNKFVIGLNVVAMLITGYFAMTNLPIDAVPDITNNQVQVVTVSPSLVPQEMEQFITYPIEMAVANIPNVEEVRSISRFGLSVVTIVFNDRVPILEARQFVKEQLAIASSEIPEGLGNPEMMPITTGLGEVYQYTLQVDDHFRHKYDAMQLRTIQDWIVKRQLNGIKGIIEISSFGGYVRQYEVAVDPIRLSELAITIPEVYEALQNNNENSGGSYIEQGPEVFYIRTEGIVKDFGDIENIVVKQVDGVPVLVKHIGQVRYGHPPRFGAMTIDGKGETVGGITLMLKGGNSSEAITNVHERVAQVQKSLPEGISIEPYLDRSILVNKTIGTVSNNLIEGGLIVIFVLILLLGNLRAGVIVASVIPMALLFAFIMMRIFGVSANLMSLGAIDFGIVIDGAVIIIEAVLHFMTVNFIGKKLSQKEMDDAIRTAASKTISSAVFGVIIILIVFVPIMTLTGIEGKMFMPMAQTVSFAILGAFILSITYVPVAASLLLKKEVKARTTFADRIVNGLRKMYKPSLQLALRRPFFTIGSTLAALLITIFIFSRMGAEFIPTLEEGDLAMQMTLRPGSSLNASIRSSTRAEQILIKNFPEVRHVVSKIGTAEVPTDPMAVEEADIMIILKEKEEWVSATSREELVAKMKAKLSVIKAASFEFTQPIQLRFNELMTGSKADVAVKIFGDDLEKLHTTAIKAAEIISEVTGAGDVKVEQTAGLPQMMVSYDREKMALHGIDIKALNQVIRSAYAGEVAGVVYEGERRFDMVIRLAKREAFKLSRLFILNARGALVPLSELAHMEIKDGPMQITREDAHRRISIGINIRNRDVASFIKEVRGRLERELPLEPGYYIRYGGQFENLEAARERLMIAVPIALGLIFVMLFFAFDSFKYALLIYTTVPMSAIGGVVALYLRGMPFSISAGVGFIALFGVAVLNGIVLISHFNQLRKESDLSVYDVVVTGAMARMRPVIMTAAVASLGFLPMALSSTAGAEVQKPLATVVIGGLISSTLLTLILLPLLYNLVEKTMKNKKLALTVVLPILFMLPPVGARTQPLSLQAAVDSALVANPVIISAELAKKDALAARKGSVTLDLTRFSLGYGQFNTLYNDAIIEISQGFGNLPEQIKAVKSMKVRELYEEEKARLIKRAIVKDVKIAWQDVLYRLGVVRFLNAQLAINSAYYRKAEHQVASGELSHTDLSIIFLEQSDLYRQQALAEIDYEEAVQHLRELTRIEGAIIPADSLVPLPFDSENLNNQLDPALLQPQKFSLDFESAKLKQATMGYFPELSISYFNQSIDGVDGFNGIRGGIAIPVWFKPQRQAVERAKISLEVAQNQYRATEQAYSFRQQAAIRKLEKISALYRNSSSTMEQSSSDLIHSIETRLQLGEIDYFTYTQMRNRVNVAAMNRLDLINKLNKAIIEVEFYSYE